MSTAADGFGTLARRLDIDEVGPTPRRPYEGIAGPLHVVTGTLRLTDVLLHSGDLLVAPLLLVTDGASQLAKAHRRLGYQSGGVALDYWRNEQWSTVWLRELVKRHVRQEEGSGLRRAGLTARARLRLPEPNEGGQTP